MTFIVYLYKEGGPCDGDDFAVGVFVDEEAAEAARDALAPLGSARVLPLHETAAELLEALS